MKADERFMHGPAEITTEVIVCVVTVFVTIIASALAVHFGMSWPGAIRVLASIAGA